MKACHLLTIVNIKCVNINCFNAWCAISTTVSVTVV